MRRKDPGMYDKIIAYINDYFEINLRSPSLGDIAQAMSVSRPTVLHYLNDLRDQGVIDFDGRYLRTEEIQTQYGDMNRVALLGEIPCGPLQLDLEDKTGSVSLPIALFGTGPMFILRAAGDSMSLAGIDDGDMVLCRQTEDARSGDIVVAYVEGEGSTLKRYLPDPRHHRIILHPENPDYEDIIVSSCRIQGVVSKVIKDIRKNYTPDPIPGPIPRSETPPKVEKVQADDLPF